MFCSFPVLWLRGSNLTSIVILGSFIIVRSEQYFDFSFSVMVFICYGEVTFVYVCINTSVFALCILSDLWWLIIHKHFIVVVKLVLHIYVWIHICLCVFWMSHLLEGFLKSYSFGVTGHKNWSKSSLSWNHNIMSLTISKPHVFFNGICWVAADIFRPILQ